MKKVVLSLLCLVSLMAATNTVALADQSDYKKLTLSGKNKKYKSLDLPADSAKKFSRVTWSTNMVEWLLFAPNMGVEIDLKDPTLISCPSLFFQFSYRPGKEDFMKHESYNVNALYYWRARAEYRWHFRFNERREQRKGLGKTAMWANEQFFTKKIETLVPDTAAINAGQEGATKYVMSKEGRIQEKIDSTMNSTIQRKTELFPGRYYLGAYGEYMNFTYNNRMIPIFGKNMKQGVAYSMGLSGGYDFPGFNYNHKCFLQWSVGASLGLLWFNYDEYNAASSKTKPYKEDVNKVLPFITELKVALNFRNTTITKKYWQPDPSVYTDNIRRNHDDSIHMAEIDTVLAEHPVIINVTSVNGVDSAFIENIDKVAIVNAFRQSTGLTYLMPNDFNMLQTTQEGINKKELSDNYFIEYVTTNRLRNYQDSVFVSERKNLQFKLQIAGREEADSLKQSFVDSLKNYYAANNTRPIFYGEPATRDSLKGFISKDSIAAQFSRIWGHKLDTAWIRTLYTSYNVQEEDGSYATYYDSVITEQQINLRQPYAMFIQFHPQVTLNGEDDGVARFRVAMAGADDAKKMYNTVASFINKMARAQMGKVRIQRYWNGKDDTYERPVTKEEVLAALKNYGLEDIDERVVYMSDTAKHFHDDVDTIVFNFGVTEDQLTYYYEVSDSIGLAQNWAQYNDTLRPWLAEQYYQPRNGLYEDNPLVPGYFDSITNEWYVNADKLLESVKDITFTTVKPYLIDTLVWKVQATPFKNGQFAGKYLARALMKIHREHHQRDGRLSTYQLFYLIEPVESKEAAGWVAPVVETPVDSTATAMRDSVVYVLDSLGNVIDSTMIQVPVSLPDSLIQGAVQTGDSASLVAAAPVVEEVKQLTVAEATEASKVAADLAKTLAAEAKAAAAAAKKAKGVANKQAKASANAIKKAQAAVKDVPDSVVVTTDSLTYTTDSLGNVIDSAVVTVEHKVANVLDSVQMAAIAERDSIIAVSQAAADSTMQLADSLQAVADAAAVKAAEAKTAAAEAKKAIAEAKKAEKAAAAEAKKRAKEEAAAAKKKSKEKVTAAAEETVEKAVESAAAAVEKTEAPAKVEQAAEAVSQAAATVTSAVESATTNNNVETAATEGEAPVEATAEEANRPMTVAEANEALAAANAAAKQAAADAKTAAANLKKAQKDAAANAKAAAAAQKKVPVLSEFDEPSPAILEAKQLADSLQQIADMSQSVIDSLQNVVAAANQKVTETKAAAAEAKKLVADVKKAEKAAAAEAKKKAKEEAAAKKAAAKAEAAAKKAAEAEAKRLAKEEAAAAKEAAKAAEKEEAEKSAESGEQQSAEGEQTTNSTTDSESTPVEAEAKE